MLKSGCKVCLVKVKAGHANVSGGALETHHLLTSTFILSTGQSPWESQLDP